MERLDGRRPDQLRPVRIVPGYLPHAEGSALIEQGGTVVLCAVSVEDRLPPFLRDKGGGWVTAEYGMLPRSTHTRSPREASQGRVGGRTHEIQRLIGRALRAVTRLDILGERTFTVDCDVIQADAGTRCAAITGAYVALRQACELAAGAPHPVDDAAARCPRRRQRRHSRRRAAARPHVRGGLARGGRLQHRARRRRASSSKCRARRRARPSRGPRSTRCYDSPVRASASCWRRRAGRWRPRSNLRPS